MKFSKYQVYKETNIEWIGKIPESWHLKRVGHHVDFITGFAFKSEQFSFVKGVRLVRGDNVTEGRLRWGEKTRYWPEVTNYLAQYLLKKKDILIGMDGSKVGKNYAIISDTDLPLLLVQRVARLRTDNELDYRYLAYLIGSKLFRTWTTLVKTDPAIPHISPANIKNFPIPFPSHGEQLKIANFLDHETAKIDILIEKQQQLIKLLKEKRQAVISHAVTKGLNPDATMRDSGVEWLGEVPEHWAIAKLAYRYEVLLGKMLDDKKITGNHLESYLRNTDVQWDSINDKNLPKMDFRPEERERYSVLKGDLLVCEGGEIGRCAIWDNNETCYYQKALHRLRPLNFLKDHTRFMFYLLFDAVHQERFISGAGKTTIAHLPAEAFRQYRFSFPPYAEQKEISKYLDEQKAKYDFLELKVEQQIALLGERRTALISAAVTGKIDVRNWHPPEQNQIHKEGAA